MFFVFVMTRQFCSRSSCMSLVDSAVLIGWQLHGVCLERICILCFLTPQSCAPQSNYPFADLAVHELYTRDPTQVCCRFIMQITQFTSEPTCNLSFSATHFCNSLLPVNGETRPPCDGQGHNQPSPLSAARSKKRKAQNAVVLIARKRS